MSGSNSEPSPTVELDGLFDGSKNDGMRVDIVSALSRVHVY